MSPVRACTRHGRGACPICAAVNARRAQARRRPYSGTAEYDRMRAAVIDAYGSSCALCGEAIDLELGDRDLRSLVLAHVVAHDDGGRFELANLRPAHLSCNASAGRDPIIGA
jgi:5-methylcytosine-specific restriction endonuclease McrA